MANPWLLLIPFFGPLAYTQQANLELAQMITTPTTDPFKDPGKWITDNAPILLGAGVTAATILGLAAMAKDAFQHRIVETWTNQPPTPDYERAGQFRKYLKGWIGRHKKELKTIAGIGLLGGTLAAASKLKEGR